MYMYKLTMIIPGICCSEIIFNVHHTAIHNLRIVATWCVHPFQPWPREESISQLNKKSLEATGNESHSSKRQNWLFIASIHCMIFMWQTVLTKAQHFFNPKVTDDNWHSLMLYFVQICGITRSMTSKRLPQKSGTRCWMFGSIPCYNANVPATT